MYFLTNCVVFQAPGCCLPGDVLVLLPASVVYYKLQFTISGSLQVE